MRIYLSEAAIFKENDALSSLVLDESNIKYGDWKDSRKVVTEVPISMVDDLVLE